MAVAKTVEKTKLIVRVEAGEGTYKNMTFNSIKERATFLKREMQSVICSRCRWSQSAVLKYPF